ncbi:MAG: ABC transporter substrate-binding protein, partial [Halanaeroarchaeum sp.]
MSPSTSLRRRAFVAGAASALAGCTGVSGISDGGDRPVTLSITAPPADDDPYAIRIARSLSQHLERVGVSTSIVPMATRELLESVLVNHDFELFVGRYPGRHDPDFLRPLVHSRWGPAAGWQNPYGFAADRVDDLLAEQRTLTGGDRFDAVSDLQRALIRTSPFAVVAHPDVVHAVRSDRFATWPSAGIQSAGDFLAIRPDESHSGPLRIAITDARPTINRNPLSVKFRYRGLLCGLLYEPLGRWREGQFVSRLATERRWSTDEDGSRVRITLPDATWHDGEPVTADDVAFTYRFVADTALGATDTPVPA